MVKVKVKGIVKFKANVKVKVNVKDLTLNPI